MVLVFILPIWGSFYYLQYQKKVVQKHVKRQIMHNCNDEDLVFMAFTHEESRILLNWKHSKEFEYNGEMYDIVSKKETSDSVFYKLWWDKEETAINQKVKQLANSIFSHAPDRQNDESFVNIVFKSLFYEKSLSNKKHIRYSRIQPFSSLFSVVESVLENTYPPPKA